MYDFELTDFGLSQEGIHLLRSGHNYSTIEYQDIRTAVIKRDSEIKNVMLTLIFAALLIAFTIFQTIYIVLRFKKGGGSIYIETIVAPVLPAMIAIYLLIQGLKKGPVLLVETTNRKYKLRLRDIVKQGKENAMAEFLKQKISYKLSVQTGVKNSL